MSAAIDFRQHYKTVRARLLHVTRAVPAIIYPHPIGPHIPSYGDLALPPTTQQRAREILRETAEKHGLTTAEIVGESRSARLVLARHEVCYRMRKETTWSLPRIGRFLGDRDHTTVMNGIRKHAVRNGLPT